jgi:hypothetical protein
MPLNDRLSRAGALIKAVGALLALLPGIAILLGLVAIPPSLADLIKFISIFVSVAVVLAVMLLSKPIARMGTGAAAAIVVICALVGAGLATTYFTFARNHVVAVQDGPETRQYLIPLHPSAEIAQLMEPYEGDYVEALETSVQRQELAQALDRESGGTMALIVVLLISAQTLVITAIVVGAWKLTGRNLRNNR